MKLFSSLKTWFVIWVWNHTPNCAEMSRLASRSLEQRPSPTTWLRMRLHHLICAWCKRYFKQLSFLHASAPQFDAHPDVFSNRGLSPEARQRIVQRLQAAKNDNP